MWGTRSPTHRHNNNRQTMDHKTLVNRFTKACYRFEAIQEDLDILLFDTDDEIKANEYEDLADQAAEIVLKLSANGNNVGGHFYHYYLRRLEYIIAYFRELLDYEETPLAEDEQNEQDDEPTAVGGFEGFPADCAFPKFPDFFSKVGVLVAPTAKAEENAAPDEADTVEEDEQSDEVDNEDDTQTAAEEDDSEDEQSDENDTQAAESDEAADDIAAGAPISDFLLPPDVGPITERTYNCWGELTSEQRAEVRDTCAMWNEMSGVAERDSGGGDSAKAAEELDDAECLLSHVRYLLIKGYPLSLIHNEQKLRKRINKAIDAIPGFRDSEEFKRLIERYPTYNEKEQ